METDWAENRAKLPQDFIRSALGKVFTRSIPTGERDRFRTRLERNASGGTEIYISHRGMIEVYNNTQKDQTGLAARARPRAGAEFLRRRMVRLGVPREQSRALVAAGAAKPDFAHCRRGQPAGHADRRGLRPRLRRVGLTLDRTGFTVEDRDRSQAPTSCATWEPNPDRKEPGFFGGAVWRCPAPMRRR